MDPKNEVFFGNTGLTNTEANYLANIAKEKNQNDLARLSKLSFMNVQVTVNGVDYPYSTGTTEEEVNKINDTIKLIGQRNSFCAWVREAIKAKDSEIAKIQNMSLQDYCEMKGIEYPVSPTRLRQYTEDEALATLSLEKRMEYYRLEALASVYGKLIHPDKPYSKALSILRDKIANPIKLDTQDTNLVVYSYTPSGSVDVFSGTFLILQENYRKVEASLNNIKTEIMKLVEKTNIERTSKANEDYTNYANRCKELSAEFSLWMNNEAAKVGSLKIVIPESLVAVMNEIKE